MRLSTSTNIFFNRPDGSKAPIEESIRLCADAGYHVMDINFHDCTTFRLPFVTNQYEYWLEGIEKLAAERGIEFSQAHSPFYNFCDAKAAKKEEIDPLILRAIDCCARLEIPWMVIHAGTDFQAIDRVSSSKSKNLEYFKPVVEYAVKKGVGIAFENLWDLNVSPKRLYTTEVAELVDLVDSFQSDKVGCCYDVEHATIMQQDQAAQLRYIGKRLKATHISDCINIDSDHLLPFTGRTDWRLVMEVLGEIGYEGDFTYEIHTYTAKMPDELVPQALKYSIAVGNYLLSLCEGKRR